MAENIKVPVNAPADQVQSQYEMRIELIHTRSTGIWGQGQGTRDIASMALRADSMEALILKAKNHLDLLED